MRRCRTILARLALLAGVLASGCRDRPEIDRLAALAKNSDMELRVQAAVRLGKLGGGDDFLPAGTGPAALSPEQQRAVVILAGLVANDPESRVRHAAARSLGQLRPGGYQPELLRCVDEYAEDLARDNRPICLRALLVVADPENVRALVERLGNDPGGDRHGGGGQGMVVGLHLEELGNRVVPYIAELLPRASSGAIVENLLHLLDDIGTQESLDLLVTLLDHPEGRVRARTLMTLRDGEHTDAYRARIEFLLDDPYESARVVAAEILGVSLPAAPDAGVTSPSPPGQPSP